MDTSGLDERPNRGLDEKPDWSLAEKPKQKLIGETERDSVKVRGLLTPVQKKKLGINDKTDKKPTPKSAAKAYHEVVLTQDLESKEVKAALVNFIGKHISDFQGESEEGNPITEEHFAIPRMLFESGELAHNFANEFK